METLDLQPVPKNIPPVVDPNSPEAMLRPDELNDTSLAEEDAKTIPTVVNKPQDQTQSFVDLQPITKEEPALDLQPVQKETGLDLQPIQKGTYAVPSPDPSIWDRVKGAYLTTSDFPKMFSNWVSDVVTSNAIDPNTGKPQGKDFARKLRQEFQTKQDEKYTYDTVDAGLPEFIGAGTRILTDPVALATLPIGGEGELFNFARLAKLAGLGAAYGVGEDTLKQLQDTGAVTDPGSVFQRGLEGAIILPAGDILLRSAGKLIKISADKVGLTDKLAQAVDSLNNIAEKQIAKVYAPRILEDFNTKLDTLQDHIVEQVAHGNEGANAVLDAELRMGQHPDETMAMLEATGRKLTMPTNQEEATKILRASDLGREDVAWKNNFINDLATPISTGIRELEPRVFNTLRKMEYTKRAQFHESINTVEPFLSSVDKLPTSLKKVVNDALRNRDFNTVRDVFKARKDTEALKGFNDAQNQFKKQWEFLKEIYPDVKQESNFWPRVIKDKKAFFNALGKKNETLLQNALDKLEAKLGRRPDPWMEAEIATNLLRDGRPRMTAPGTIFRRTIKTIPEQFTPHYADARTSAHMYFHRTTDDIAKRNFFGRAIKYTSKDRKTVDINQTIGSFIAQNTRFRKSDEAFHELQRLLKLRFVEGEQRPHAVIRAAKDLTYGGTLSNLWSDLTQLKDVGNVMSRYGVTNTIKSIVGKRAWKAVDLALTDIAAELEHSPSATSRYVERSLKYSGFQRADIFGKTLAMNGAWNKYTKMALTDKGKQFIYKKYAKAMGQDVFPLINDLAAKKKTDLTGFFIFHELLDMQPIALSEMPAYWLKSPNWRIGYALRSFTLKQMDMVINDTVREAFRRGNYKQGAKMALRYTIYLSAAGMSVDIIKDLLKGKEINPKDIPAYVVNNMLQVFGGSKFMTDQLGQNKAADALLSVYDPAFRTMVGTVYSDIYKNIYKQDSLRPEGSKLDPEKFYLESSKYLGVPGSFWYWWAGPGKDKVMKSNTTKENQQ